MATAWSAQETLTKEGTSLPGFEPGIFWSVVRRVIRCATSPVPPAAHLQYNKPTTKGRLCVTYFQMAGYLNVYHGPYGPFQYMKPTEAYATEFKTNGKTWSLLIFHPLEASRDSSVGRAEDCSWNIMLTSLGRWFKSASRELLSIFLFSSFCIPFTLKTSTSEWLKVISNIQTSQMVSVLFLELSQCSTIFVPSTAVVTLCLDGDVSVMDGGTSPYSRFFITRVFRWCSKPCFGKTSFMQARQKADSALHSLAYFCDI